MDSKNYYDILGITEEEKKLQGKEFEEVLSRKYKKLAMKWHPDRWVNGTDEEKKKAEEMFKDISEANAVLSDSNQRQQYDMSQSGFSGFDTGDFSGFNPFGGFPGFSNFYNQGWGNPPASIENVDVSISFSEFYTGCEKEVDVPSGEPCEHCNGTGSKDGQRHPCPHCNGTGKFVNRQQRGNTIMEQVSICPHCQGTGTVITDPCPHCNGTGKKKSTKKITLKIPAGVEDGTVFTVNIEHNTRLNVAVHVEMDDYFKVSQNNIFHFENVSLKDALLGCKREIRLPSGKKQMITIHECTQPGEKFVFKGEGIMQESISLFRRGGKGDYVVIIQYDIPQSLTNKQRELIKKF